MEVKSGYKQTELGAIPQDWSIARLSEIADVRGGIAKNSNVIVADPVSVHYLRVANVQDGYLDLSDLSRIEISRQDLKRYSVLPGDVLMNEGGDLDKLGRGAIWKGDFSPCVHQNHVFAVRCKPELIPEYLDIWTGTKTARKFFLLAGKQTTNLASISKSSLGNLPVALPSLREQHAITIVFSDVDALLNGLAHLIAKKRDLKHAAMQQLLTGKTRLPGFSGDWKVGTIGELEKQRLVKLSRGNVISKKDIENIPGDFPIYSSSVHNDGLFGRYGGFMFDEELITWSVDGGGNFFHRTKHKFSVTNVCGFMRVDPSRISYQYLAAKLQLLHSRKSFDYQSKAHPSVVRKEYEVWLPPLPEQAAIAAVLSDMDAEVNLLEAHLAKTRAIKQSMMQELLTGKTRLVDISSKVVSGDFKKKLKTESAKQPTAKSHNWAINEAVVVAVLVKHFGSDQYPLGRKRCTKLSYLMHRHVEHVVEGYLKKAAGPYNPSVKYKGPEGIAQKNGYIRAHTNGKLSGFVAAENISQAENYFEKWFDRDRSDVGGAQFRDRH